MKKLWAGALAVLTLLACSGCMQNTQAEAAGETQIVFSESGAQAEGASGGYTIQGTDVTITAAGVYRLSGESSEGTVTVQENTQGVTLIFDGLSLQSASSAPVICGKNTQVALELAQNSSNTLINSEPADDTQAEGAAIKVKTGASLSITGAGILNCEGLCKNGIKGAAQAEILIDGPTLTIDAQTNGLASDGTVTICSGTIAVWAQEDGIAAGESLVVSGGALDIQTGQGHEQLADETVSTKCLKSDAALSITGGTFVLDSAEDGVHGVEVQLLSGSFSIAAADDAIHADEALTIGQASGEGPAIDISTCYEGLEGAQVYLNAGSVNLCATDDGINAAGDESGAAGYLIEISDGDYWIDAGGDGLDSNGNIAMTGGTMEIYGAPNQENSALDYENGFDYQGGTLLAAGITGMTQTPTGLCVVFGEDGSMGGMRGSAQQPPDGEIGGQQQPAGAAQTPLEQPDEQTDGQTMEESDDVPRGGPAAAQIENALLEEGTAFSIQDEAGNVLYEGTGVKQANSIIFACGQLAEGQTYSLVVNGQAVATAQAAQQQGTGGRMAGPGGLGQA